METLLDLLEGSAARYGDRNALGLRRDDGTSFHWSYREVLRRSRLAAWRLRALGLQPGDRVLTWSPSTPALPAAYYGAMYARLIYVPLDSRMSTDAISNIITASGAVRLLLGSGRDAPDPREVGLERFPTTIDRVAVRGAGRDLPRRLGGAGGCLGAAGARRYVPAGVHVRHHGQPQGRDAHPRQRAGRRRVLPPDHQPDGAPARLAAAALALAGAGGLAVLRDGRGGGHPLRAQPEPAGDLRLAARAPGDDHAPGPPAAGPVLERGRARGGEAGPDGDLQPAANRSRAGCPTAPGVSSSGASTRSSAAACGCSRRPARSCRPRSSRRGRTWASSSSRGTAPPRPRQAAARRWTTIRWAAWAGRRSRSRCGSPMTARSSSAARTCSRPTGTTQRRRPKPSPTDGWYKSGDLGRLDEKGRLHLHGRKKDIIVLPNGFNVYPGGPRERAAGRRDPGFRGARDEARPDRGGGARRPRRTPRPGIARATPAIEGAPPEEIRHDDRGRGEAGERGPGTEPADRGLAALAGGGLPADAHVQGASATGSVPGPRSRRRCRWPRMARPVQAEVPYGPADHHRRLREDRPTRAGSQDRRARISRRSAARRPSPASPPGPPPRGPDRPSATTRRTRGSGPGAG